jgi:hypothetical protein
MTAILRPNADHMAQQLRHVFDGLSEDCQNAEIELAHTAPNERGPRYARLFPVTNIEKAVEFAAKINAQEGCNLYFGPALRKPGRPNKRSSTKDILALTAPAALAMIMPYARNASNTPKFVHAQP